MGTPAGTLASQMTNDESPPTPSPFEGRLVRLRAPEEADSERIHDLLSDAGVLETNPIWPFGTSLDQLRERWQKTRANPDPAHVPFVVETLTGELVGNCGLFEVEPQFRTASAGIAIGKDHWDRGYGTDALRTLCRFGFGHMNLHRIELTVSAANPRGLRAYEKVGFRVEGYKRQADLIRGERCDLILMGLLHDELAGD